jgi:hypothetical protein
MNQPQSKNGSMLVPRSFMSVSQQNSPRLGLRWRRRIPVIGLVLACAGLTNADGAARGRAFDTPENAVQALAAAVNARDRDALRAILGPGSEDLQNPDRVQGNNELANFAAAFNADNRVVHESAQQCVLEMGTNSWPFPIPIIQENQRWYFDTEAGKEELLNRRIGRNELDTLESVRAYVVAQREYASQDQDDDEVLEFAQRIRSTPGTKDGLFWPADLDGTISPLGPLAAEAQNEGYVASPTATGPQPFHGYYFRILTRQGKHAPGGKYNYVINGNMIAGFALVAWPASYDESGVMTFIVNQQGKVYQQDLGSNTAKIAAKMTEYDPAPGWDLSPD